MCPSPRRYAGSDTPGPRRLTPAAAAGRNSREHALAQPFGRDPLLAGGDGRAAALTDAQLDSLTAFALRSYVRWGSLLGSPDTCRANLADLADLGCDEVACFVDFGVGRADLLAGLHRLAELRKDLPA